MRHASLSNSILNGTYLETFPPTDTSSATHPWSDASPDKQSGIPQQYSYIVLYESYISNMWLAYVKENMKMGTKRQLFINKITVKCGEYG